MFHWLLHMSRIVLKIVKTFKILDKLSLNIPYFQMLKSTKYGPSTLKSLSQLEERLLSILGTTFYSGVYVKEQGVSKQ